MPLGIGSGHSITPSSHSSVLATVTCPGCEAAMPAGPAGQQTCEACGFTAICQPDGVWDLAPTEALAYPPDGHMQCAQIEDGSFWFRHRNRVIVDCVRRFPPTGPMWDIGGGNGFVACGLEHAGFPTVLLEPSEAGPRHARARGLARVIRGRLEDPHLGTAPWHAAGAFDVIEHVADDAAFVRQVASHLQPGGRLFVTVPAGRALWSNDDVAAMHHRRYSRASLCHLLTGAGLDVQYASHFMAPLVLPILALRAVPDRFRGLASPEAVAADPAWVKRARAGHHERGGLAARAMAGMLGLEQRLLQRAACPVGASLLAVATRA